MNNMRPLVSILTPTWNRVTYLDRVWCALNSQTYKNIEWIVCDDGSTDDTAVKLQQLAAKSAFPVTIVTASVHIGKARMDNEGISRARGEFILWNDSDDYLLPHAIEQLVAAWYSVPQESHHEYAGIAALCSSQWGVASTPLPKNVVFDTSWNELSEELKVTGDMVAFTKSSLLKQNPFPEVDFVVPEGVLWTTIGHLKIRLCPEILQIKEYKAVNCISFNGRMEYCRGRAYAMAVSVRNRRSYPSDMKTRLWNLITYLRYSIHGEMGFHETASLWGLNSLRVTMLLMLPVAYLLALKDEIRPKVRRTHRDYLIAEARVKIIESKVNGYSQI